jgi:hypothetical protein
MTTDAKLSDNLTEHDSEGYNRTAECDMCDGPLGDPHYDISHGAICSTCGNRIKALESTAEAMQKERAALRAVIKEKGLTLKADWLADKLPPGAYSELLGLCDWFDAALDSQSTEAATK